MPEKWEPKLAALEGTEGWGKMQLEDLISALAMHELKFEKKQLDQQRVDSMNKSLALKIIKEDENDIPNNDDEMVMFS